MNKALLHIFRFFIFAALQIFVLNQLELGFGLLLMIYPLFIFLLPVEMDVLALMVISFIMGFCIDSLSNTFGLHTSSLLLFAYLRPIIFKSFAPREEYETNKETNMYTMGFNWFLYTFGSLLLIQHFWFFLFEISDLSQFFFLLQKVMLSLVLSFLLCVGLQIIFVKKPKEK